MAVHLHFWVKLSVFITGWLFTVGLTTQSTDGNSTTLPETTGNLTADPADANHGLSKPQPAVNSLLELDKESEPKVPAQFSGFPEWRSMPTTSGTWTKSDGLDRLTGGSLPTTSRPFPTIGGRAPPETFRSVGREARLFPPPTLSETTEVSDTEDEVEVEAAKSHVTEAARLEDNASSQRTPPWERLSMHRSSENSDNEQSGLPHPLLGFSSATLMPTIVSEGEIYYPCESQPCLNNGTCTNLPGAFYCNCTTGYTGKNCELDVNECEELILEPQEPEILPLELAGQSLPPPPPPHAAIGEVTSQPVAEVTEVKQARGPCKNGATCKNLEGSYQCICRPGFEGKDCGINIDDCDSDPCLNGGVCVDLENEYQCQCEEKFAGKNCEIELDECHSQPCHNGAICTPLTDNYLCHCKPGFKGRNCQVNEDNCDPNPCRHGTCVDSVNSYTCNCFPGFEGENCEINIDDCKNQPCQGGASCTDGINEYICHCPAGLTGTNCEVNRDDCESGPCYNGATCHDRLNSYECECLPGYVGARCENNIDECAVLSPCQNGGTCRSDEKSRYLCQCPDGFDGRNCEVNINECANSTCQNDAACIDLINDFSCKCLPGFEGKLCEIEIDECHSQPCQNNATCVDALNSYECKCVKGFRGKNCEIDINECDPDPCSNGTCLDLVNHYQCKCNEGYTGDRCETPVNPCDANPCVFGLCEPQLPNFACICSSGYTGKLCDLKVDNCQNQSCQNGGTCQNVEYDFICNCPKGYKGRFCEKNINECEENLCSEYTAECVDLIGHYECVCKAGYEGTYCDIEINECESQPCQHGATCLDRVDKFECQCPPGFTGSLCEADINECESNPCNNQGQCIDLVNGFHCECFPGFEGIQCETDIDDCYSNPCQNGATCVDKVNSYECLCQEGYAGKNCQRQIDECRATNPCRNDGICEDLINGYRCYCKPGFEGDNCEIDKDECANDPCQNGGTCENLSNDYACLCPPGYVGRNCQEDVNECESDPCQNGATCRDDINTYYCTCRGGYTGKDCETDIDECESNPCRNGATCKDLENRFECECLDGFSGLECHININECDGDPCLNGGTCSDGINNYTCSCPPGFIGLHCETNIDDCLSLPCQNEGTCIDQINSYECECAPGFSGLNCEIDIDDCASSPCKNSATCIDQVLGFVCKCAPGFMGLKCEVNFDECSSDPCANNATCVDGVNGFSCSCIPGYTGETCETEIDECHSGPCKNNGTCTDKLNDYHCNCAPGFEGKNCEVDINECDAEPCFYGATCIDLSNNYKCFCVPGYTGKNCSIDINECESNPCQNEGECMDRLNGYECTCIDGFKGKNCEININECEDNPCQNGNCVDQVNDFTCDCSNTGYRGRLCEENIDDCVGQPCKNNGNCTDQINNYTCTCAPGFTGPNCEINIDECQQNPCQNGGTCVDGINGYNCTCTPGYSGKNCAKCSNARECNIHDGCCMTDIVFNSLRSNKDRSDIKYQRSNPEFFGLYSRNEFDSTSGRIVYTKKKQDKSAIFKKLKFDPQTQTWIALATSDETNPKPYWFSSLKTRCLTKSTSNSISVWTYETDEDEGVRTLRNHTIEIICQSKIRRLLDKTENDTWESNPCGAGNFTCISRNMCIPEHWRCDGIYDCDDFSDECPQITNQTSTLRDSSKIKIVNDIKSNPKLSVVGRVIIGPNAFRDPSGHMTNLTVEAFKGKTLVEKHECQFNGSHEFACSRDGTKFLFYKLEVARIYGFKMTACNYAGCASRRVTHDTQNWNCGSEDNYKNISRSQVCDSTDDCPIGKRDEEELICQGSPFTRNISLTIFLYLFCVLVGFVICKQQGYFKCHHADHFTPCPPGVIQKLESLKDQMCRIRANGSSFKLEYERCHESKNEHFALAAMIGYILSFKENKFLRKTTFTQMNEVENMFHSTPQQYYRCIRERFGNEKIVEEFVAYLEYEYKKAWIANWMSAAQKVIKRLTPTIPEEGYETQCCGIACRFSKAKQGVRPGFSVAVSNLFVWTHFSMVLFNMVDLVKDITFTSAVQHYDSNIVQDFEGVSRYQQFYEFNVCYVFLISLVLMVFSSLITQIYWAMVTRKPRFLMGCSHQNRTTKVMQWIIQNIPCTLSILLFAEDAAIKIRLGQLGDRKMNPADFKENMELLYEEKLIEKLALNIKIIEVVCEAFGQLVVQSVVLLRLKTLIQTDYFKYLGISFEEVIMISMIISVFSMFSTFWSYHVRSKQYFRPVLSVSTLLQFLTWFLLISTKLLVYVLSFINFPALFVVPVILQFIVTSTVLSFTKVSPRFRDAPWHDRMIHCMVCCVLPVAVSDDPHCQLHEINLDILENDVPSPGENRCEEHYNSLRSFTSLIESIRNSDRRPLNRHTSTVDFVKKSRYEMGFALGLYTFECFSVISFSLAMYTFYPLESYRQFLQQFVKDKGLDVMPLLKGVYGMYGSLYLLVVLVVALASILILTYYRHLHPRGYLFALYQKKRKQSLNGNIYTVSEAVEEDECPDVYHMDAMSDKSVYDERTYYCESESGLGSIYAHPASIYSMVSMASPATQPRNLQEQPPPPPPPPPLPQKHMRIKADLHAGTDQQDLFSAQYDVLTPVGLDPGDQAQSGSGKDVGLEPPDVSAEQPTRPQENFTADFRMDEAEPFAARFRAEHSLEALDASQEADEGEVEQCLADNFAMSAVDEDNHTEDEEGEDKQLEEAKAIEPEENDTPEPAQPEPECRRRSKNNHVVFV